MQYETKSETKYAPAVSDAPVASASASAAADPEVIRGLDDDEQEETIKFIIGRAIPEFYPNGVEFIVKKKRFTKMSPVIEAAYADQISSTDVEPPSAYDKMHPDAFAKIVEYVEKFGDLGPQPIPNSPCDSVDFSFCVPRIVDSEGKSHPGWDYTFVESIFGDPTKRAIYMETLRHANFFQIDCLVRKLACRIGCVLMGKKQLMKKSDEKGEERDETPQEYADRLDDLIDPARVCRKLDQVVYIDLKTGKREVYNITEPRYSDPPVASASAAAAADDIPMSSDDTADSSSGKRKSP